MLVTENVEIVAAGANTNVAFKLRVPFTRCVTHINDEHIDIAENLHIIMPLYNLLEYSDNYAERHKQMIENIANIKSSEEKDELSENSRDNRKNIENTQT